MLLVGEVGIIGVFFFLKQKTAYEMRISDWSSDVCCSDLWLVDWGVMVLLTHQGMQVEAGNVLGRVSGALLGYWLNGKLTFASDDTALGRTQLARFVFMWLATTIPRTWPLGAIYDVSGLKLIGMT